MPPICRNWDVFVGNLQGFRTEHGELDEQGWFSVGAQKPQVIELELSEKTQGLSVFKQPTCGIYCSII